MKLTKMVMLLATGASLAFTPAAQAQSEGKKVIFVPISMGISLTEAWVKRMREHAELGGYTVDVKDAAFNTGVMSELLATAIFEKPDVLVVHNPTVQLLSRQIKQAEADGIKVVQMNLQSNQPSTAFVRGRLEPDRPRDRRRYRRRMRGGQRQVGEGGDCPRSVDRG